MAKQKLRKKFIINITVALVAVFSMLAFILDLTQRSEQTAKLSERGKMLSQIIANMSAEPMMNYNFAYLEKNAKDIAERDGDIVNISIDDAYGKTVASYVAKGLQEGSSLQFTTPISFNTEKVGTVKMSISVERLERNLRRTDMIIAALAISGIILVSLLMYMLFTRLILNPVEKVMAAMERLKSGDLTGHVDITSRDEIGALAAAVNETITSLKSMVQEIRASSTELASTAGEISLASARLDGSGHTQVAAADKTGETMTAIASSIERVAASADKLASNVDDISTSMEELGTSSEQMAKSSEIMASSVYETSATIEEMTLSIEKVAKNTEDLASSVTETSATIEEMAAAVDQVAGNSQELQQVVSETGSTIEKMAASIRQVAKNVDEADGMAKSAANEGVAGRQAVREALVAMKRVAEVMEKTADSIASLGKRSEEIGSIVKVIDEIADQTNLLALNAAIEAARAGDAGRGFAVVAEEVRKLAERSMSATGEIAQVIRQVQADTDDSVRFGEQASEEAKNSMALSVKAGSALENIVKSIERTSTLMSDIAAMAGEQASASGQVLRAVEKMNISTSVVTNAAKEQATGSRQIRIAIERMNGLTHEVTTATREQAQGSRQIRKALDEMKQVTQQVTLATKEQATSARRIVQAVEGMNAMTQSVAADTADQRRGGDEVVAAVEDINVQARENLASVEQLSASAATLSKKAERLAALVEKFKVSDGGSALAH